MGHDRPSSLVWSRMFCEVLYLETAGFSKLWLAHLPKALQRGLRTFYCHNLVGQYAQTQCAQRLSLIHI